ncbi:hypothetical protein [Roseimaritima sediminicola]|uniref:hypothetical protein n=1 Tax=Roseimaritima sediminicola TaxID=2662066 RepID=UPI0012983778|nr:hypothetical protein [Roseimaritima sediminicola]
MQSDVRDIDVLSRLLGGLAALSQGLHDTVQELRVTLAAVDHWIGVDAPAYWRQQTRAAQQDLNAALEHLQQQQSTTRPGDRPPATEAKKRVRLAKRRLQLCEDKQLACRRQRLRIEHVLQAMAGPLTEIDELAAGDLPRVQAELRSMIDVLQRYQQSATEAE